MKEKPIMYAAARRQPDGQFGMSAGPFATPRNAFTCVGQKGDYIVRCNPDGTTEPLWEWNDGQADWHTIRGVPAAVPPVPARVATPTSQISVVGIRPQRNMGNLRAFVEVKIGEITIADCRIIQQPGQRAYVSGPQKQVDGRYLPLVKMTANLRERVQTVVLSAAIKVGVVDKEQSDQPDLMLENL